MLRLLLIPQLYPWFHPSVPVLIILLASQIVFDRLCLKLKIITLHHRLVLGIPVVIESLDVYLIPQS